ncbi:hypothetical protein FH972_025239 [Carpinus fangiana]|uniref:Uncharacterized protein n=1 Tax=Carpinus fangiana TaxID=176857 RepID=A0A5N6L115_9ROSI|nr:hypothetical protein FH972_025239 [Carpinus fangiana]
MVSLQPRPIMSSHPLQRKAELGIELDLSEQPANQTLNPEPKALCLSVELAPQCFNRDLIRGKDQDIKIDVFLNGHLSGHHFIPARNNISKASLLTIFSGYKCDRVAEFPWILHPPPVTSLDSQMPEQTWETTNALLARQALNMGVNAHGKRPHSAEYLMALSAVDMPKKLNTERSHMTFGIIDVIITLGKGKKHEVTAGYIRQPQLILDSNFSTGLGSPITLQGQCAESNPSVGKSGPGLTDGDVGQAFRSTLVQHGQQHVCLPLSSEASPNTFPPPLVKRTLNDSSTDSMEYQISQGLEGVPISEWQVNQNASARLSQKLCNLAVEQGPSTKQSKNTSILSTELKKSNPKKVSATRKNVGDAESLDGNANAPKRRKTVHQTIKPSANIAFPPEYDGKLHGTTEKLVKSSSQISIDLKLDGKGKSAASHAIMQPPLALQDPTCVITVGDMKAMTGGIIGDKKKTALTREQERSPMKDVREARWVRQVKAERGGDFHEAEVLVGMRFVVGPGAGFA